MRVRRRTALSAVILTVGLVVVASCSSGGDDTSSASTASTAGGSTASSAVISGPTTDPTEPRDGDPGFCTAISDFQNAYRVIASPAAGATPAQVRAFWNALDDSTGRLTEQAPDDMVTTVQPVVAAFDQLRLDADALGYRYHSLDDLPSSATMDPDGQIAQAAYAIFTYGSSRCPQAATTTTTAG